MPLYEGRMIGQFDFSEKGWVSGKGRTAIWNNINWEEKVVNPQYLMGEKASETSTVQGLKMPVMTIGSATNSRTLYGALIDGTPCGNSLNPMSIDKKTETPILCAILNSFIFDSQIRKRLTGVNINYFILDETAVLPPNIYKHMNCLSQKICLAANHFAHYWLKNDQISNVENSRLIWSLTKQERLRIRCTIEALIAFEYDLNEKDFKFILNNCDLPTDMIAIWKDSLNPKGFWRIDKDKPPEHRLTVLSLIAFHDLQQKIAEYDGDTEKGIKAFLNQNDGEGWMLPETLRLADYGLGHDERAKEHQPVRECFGPRFFDWQIAQDPEESWRECHLHARNLLGPEGYQALIDEIEGRAPEKQSLAEPLKENTKKKIKEKQIQYTLFSQDKPESGNS